MKNPLCLVIESRSREFQTRSPRAFTATEAGHVPVWVPCVKSCSPYKLGAGSWINQTWFSFCWAKAFRETDELVDRKRWYSETRINARKTIAGVTSPGLSRSCLKGGPQKTLELRWEQGKPALPGVEKTNLDRQSSKCKDKSSCLETE